MKDSTPITFPEGYYNFSQLKSLLEASDITIERLADNKVTIVCSKTLNLKNFGPLIGFTKDKVIQANTKTTSTFSASLTNGLKDISVFCSLIDATRVFSQTSQEASNMIHSIKFFDVSIDTTQSLNGDFTEYNLGDVQLPCRSFYAQEFEMFVESGGDRSDYEIYLTLRVSH